jgi:hypothetical protein
MYRGRTAAYLLLLVLAVLAVLLFVAFVLGLETLLLMLYMVGVIRPGLAIPGVIIAFAAYQALRPQRDRTLLLLSALSIVMLPLIALPAPFLPPLLLAYATLTAGLAIHKLGGRELILASGIGLCLPALAYGFAAIGYSPVGAQAELSRVMAQEAEVTGTLRWEKEGPALVAERNRLYDIVEERQRQFPIAVMTASALLAVGSFAASFMVTAYRQTVAQGMLIGSFLSIIQAILAICWLEFWR